MNQQTCPKKCVLLGRIEHHVMLVAMYSHFRNYAPPLDEKGGIITEKVFPVFSENFVGAYFEVVM